MTNKPLPKVDCPAAFRVHDHVPMAHVIDVDRSVDFYALLGFKCASRFADDNGRTYYAAVRSGQAELMLVLASGPVDASQQAVLFYMYSQDVHSLRSHLLNKGIPDAGRAPGLRKPGDYDKPIPRGPALFDPTYPPYMHEGELRVHDPDDYVILIGQCDFRNQFKPAASSESPVAVASTLTRSASEGRIGQIAITVSDVDAAVRYYRDIIGLTLLFNAGLNLAFLTDGAIRVMLSTPQGAGKIGENSILYFTVTDIEAKYAAMIEKGSATERAPQLAAKMPDHELWIGFLRDPDGNLVGIMEEKR